MNHAVRAEAGDLGWEGSPLGAGRERPAEGRQVGAAGWGAQPAQDLVAFVFSVHVALLTVARVRGTADANKVHVKMDLLYRPQSSLTLLSTLEAAGPVGLAGRPTRRWRACRRGSVPVLGGSNTLHFGNAPYDDHAVFRP